MTLQSHFYQSCWSTNHTKVFHAFKDMLSTPSYTGEQTTLDENWNNLMNTLIKISACQEELSTKKMFNSTNASSGLSQIVSWPGGKKNELDTILTDLPSYDRFFEPFVGGGSVFMGIRANEYFINDFCSDLVSLYKNIAQSNEKFLFYIEMIDMSMDKMNQFFTMNRVELGEVYSRFLTETISKKELKHTIREWIDKHHIRILDVLGGFRACHSEILPKEVAKYICSKYARMKKKHMTDPAWIDTHIKTALHGGLYNYYRCLFNDRTIASTNQEIHSAVFLYIRQYVFGGKFTYNAKGEFSESYGGCSHLKKRLTPKLDYFRSQAVKEHFSKTHIYNLDFEDFLDNANPTENDFIFLDPPYDCDFSTYDKNEFNRHDQSRLAKYLTTKCKANWMMIINRTDFILGLYKQEGIYIYEYDKTYMCNMKNNNKRKAVHLLITNYPLEVDSSYIRTVNRIAA